MESMPDRVPTALKLINGDKKARINTDEPAARELSRLPVAPSWLTLSQLNLFKQVGRELLSMRMLYSADLDVVVQYVVAADTCNMLAAKLNGLTSILVETESGMVHGHPYFTMLDRAQGRLTALATQLGLTPRARASLRLAATVPNTEAAHETASSYFSSG